VRARDRYGFWHAHFAGGDEDAETDCAEQLASNERAAPVQRLWSLVSSQLLPGHVPLRVYANGHTYGVEGYVHTDTDDEAGFTTIYYAHGMWDPDWAGETVFFSGETGDITHAVNPKPGRVIVFRGATPHAARSASRECPELRVSIVFKTKLVDCDVAT
jgi:SM-20-related protein